MRMYLQYATVEDFAVDTNFIKWTLNPDEESDQLWRQWIESHPEKAAVIEEAKMIIRTAAINNKMDDSERNDLWSAIEADLHCSHPAKVFVMKKPAKKLYRKWYIAAASILLFSIGSTFLYNYFATTIDIRTQYGELRRLKLPDGSQVTLNANSVIHYDKNLKEEETRQIWLCGEAYFSVQHTPTNQKFIVHTDEMDIEVLGTEFNVFKRNGKTKVTLNAGKVNLILNEKTGKGHSNILMAPGDLVEFSALENRYVKRKVIAANYSKWIQNKLVFDDTPLSEIAENLKHVYGWNIIIRDSSIMNESLTGEIDTDNENELLESLSKAMDLNFIKKGTTVNISR